MTGDPICAICATQEHGSPLLPQNCICDTRMNTNLDAEALLAAFDAADAASPVGRAYAPGIEAAINAYLSSIVKDATVTGSAVDPADPRTLRLFYREPVTGRDRQNVVDALNCGRRPTSDFSKEMQDALKTDAEKLSAP